MNRRFILPLFILLLLLGGWILCLQEPPNAPAQVFLPDTYGEPDALIQAGSLKRYDGLGRHYQTLYSDRVANYPDAAITTFSQPQIYHFTPKGQAWLLSARQATWRSQDSFLLEEDVSLQPLEHQFAYAPSLTTQHLWLDTVAETAYTDALVVFKSPGSQTQGLGLLADLNSGNFQLLEQVQGLHHIQPPIQDTP